MRPTLMFLVLISALLSQAPHQPTGGGPNEDDEVTITKIGEIDFEILGCEDATATVRLDGAEPQMLAAKNLTRPFPCAD